MFNPKQFWSDPDASDMPEYVKANCRPSFYLDLVHVTELVVSKIKKYLDHNSSILEVGCGTGRNLAGLARAGYKDIHGIEINCHAISEGLAKFPELIGTPIVCSPIEDAIKAEPQRDCIYTQSVLMHLPPASEWVFEAMSKRARKMIMTIENEEGEFEWAWPRDYGTIFTDLGWKEQECFTCEKWPPLPYNTVCRVFLRE